MFLFVGKRKKFITRTLQGKNIWVCKMLKHQQIVFTQNKDIIHTK